ncbi:hypothetical protein ACQKC8_22970, partial [Stutzerimonas stutzeri]|uniref:hypothetical protein n=1 Tax=Stutzerimonas stutzeri TaxID=316 RepID=UPI003C2F8CB1
NRVPEPGAGSGTAANIKGSVTRSRDNYLENRRSDRSKVSPMSRGFLLWYACVMIHKPHVNAASGLNASNVGVKHWRC